MLTVPQVAKLLKVRRDKVSGWIRGGELAAFDVGSGGRALYRVSQQALDEFAASRAVTPPKVAPRRRQLHSVPRYLQ
jgi:excisionase family DNA binding protein